MNILKAAARIILIVLIASPAFSNESNSVSEQKINTEIRQGIVNLMNKHALALNFPQSTASFYSSNKFKPVWSVKSPQKQVMDAMALLTNVGQYGLSKGSYHPEVLN